MPLGQGKGSGLTVDFPGRSRLLRDAFEFARRAHAGQTLDTDGAPYIHHPLSVGALLHEAGYRDEVAAAGLLHDTVEDSDAGLEDIAARFGPDVAELVAAVTEPPDVAPYEARKAAHRRQVVAAGEEAAAVFAADKLVSARNLRGALAARGEAAVDASLEQPLAAKLDHYEYTVRELEEWGPSLAFLPALRVELERLELQRAREHRDTAAAAGQRGG
jgi:(p)ppGpp synthase/HD superfamily hydrolase